MRIVPFAVIIFLSLTGLSQNLYDAEHRMLYGIKWYQTSQFEKAKNELQKSLLLAPQNDTAIWYLNASLIQLNQSDSIIQLPCQSSNKTSSFLFRQMNHIELFYRKSSIDSLSWLCLNQKDQVFYQLISHGLNNRWGLFNTMLLKDTLLSKSTKRAFDQTYQLGIRFKPKSPAVAGVLSIVPGAGQWYSEQKSDAVFVFLTTAISGYQAYRGYQKQGFNNAYTLFFGGFATSMYLGNIYGAVQSSKRYNKNRRDQNVKRLFNLSKYRSNIQF